DRFHGETEWAYRKPALIPPDLACQLPDHHKHRNASPKWSKKRYGVYLVDDQIEPSTEATPVASERPNVYGPLLAAANNFNAVQHLPAGSSRKRSSKPFNRMSGCDQSLRHLVRMKLGS